MVYHAKENNFSQLMVIIGSLLASYHCISTIFWRIDCHAIEIIKDFRRNGLPWVAIYFFRSSMLWNARKIIYSNPSQISLFRFEHYNVTRRRRNYTHYLKNLLIKTLFIWAKLDKYIQKKIQISYQNCQLMRGGDDTHLAAFIEETLFIQHKKYWQR
jgi:hypothetical protein